MKIFNQAKAAYDDLLEKLAEAKTAKQTVSDRVAELEERIPALEAEKTRLTKLVALGKTDNADNVKLPQVRRELADCVDDLDSLREQLAMFQPGGEIMNEILADLDAAYTDMERAHSRDTEEAYHEAVEKLMADIQCHLPRIMGLHSILYRGTGMSWNVADFFKDLCGGIKAEKTMESFPKTCPELSAYRYSSSQTQPAHNRGASVEISYGPDHGALPPEKPYEGPLYGGEILSLPRYGKLNRGVTLD